MSWDMRGGVDVGSEKIEEPEQRNAETRSERRRTAGSGNQEDGRGARGEERIVNGPSHRVGGETHLSSSIWIACHHPMPRFGAPHPTSTTSA